ncbi:MAG TPA: hypothetical protein VMV31_02445 [Terriglobales bacterium]|nr:hypothetical protein [Terriglobales bacterium]
MTFDDYRESQAAPESQLPSLEPGDLDNGGDPQFAVREQRVKLARQLSRKRMLESGGRLAAVASALLRQIDPAAALLRVELQSERDRWLLTVHRGGRDYGVPLDLETAVEVFDNKILAAEDKLRLALRSGIGADRPEVTH